MNSVTVTNCLQLNIVKKLIIDNLKNRNVANILAASGCYRGSAQRMITISAYNFIIIIITSVFYPEICSGVSGGVSGVKYCNALL